MRGVSGIGSVHERILRDRKILYKHTVFRALTPRT
jgi:hypothetical protein